MARRHAVVALVAAGLAALVVAGLRRDAEPDASPRGADAPASAPGRPARSQTRSNSREGAEAPAAASPTAPVDPRIANEPTDAVAAYLSAPVVFQATVTEARGGSPEQPGTRCRVGVERLAIEGRCRAVVECGLTRLAGAPPVHDVACTVRDGAIRTVTDEATTAGDRDPSFVLDLEQGRLHVEDDRFGMYGAYAIEADVER